MASVFAALSGIESMKIKDMAEREPELIYISATT
jgi:hypothetical protein